MATDIFTALADPTRRSIVEILANYDQLPASEIYENFQVSPQAVSKHLRILRESNVVQMEKRAQQRLYRINKDSLLEMEQWIHNVSHRWTRRLDKLDKVLQSGMIQSSISTNEGDDSQS